MWDVDKIKQQRKYVVQKLKTCSDPLERERLEFSFCTYHNILENGLVKNMKISKFLMNAVTRGNFSCKKEEDCEKILAKLILNKENYLDNDYFNFLIDIARNVCDSLDDSSRFIAFYEMDNDYDGLTKMSQKFYEDLGNSEILKFSNEFFSKDSNFQFNESYSGFNDNMCQGLTFFDPVFDTAYCSVIKNNCIFDYLAVNHEIMHYIDFKIGKKFHANNYYGFHEVPTYTIDFLFMDFLEEQGFGEDVKDIRKDRASYFKNLVSPFIPLFINSSIKSINKYNDISFDMFKKLLEIESFVISYILYERIKQDKEKGLDDLVEFMKTSLPKDKKPDFSFIGISDDDILAASCDIEFFFSKDRNR